MRDPSKDRRLGLDWAPENLTDCWRRCEIEFWVWKSAMEAARSRWSPKTTYGLRGCSLSPGPEVRRREEDIFLDCGAAMVADRDMDLLPRGTLPVSLISTAAVHGKRRLHVPCRCAVCGQVGRRKLEA